MNIVTLKVGGYSIRVIARQIKCRHLERDWHTTRFITVLLLSLNISARPDKSGILIPSYVVYAYINWYRTNNSAYNNFPGQLKSMLHMQYVTMYR